MSDTDKNCSLKLSDVKKGKTVEVCGFSDESMDLVNRLLELGFTKGSKINVIGKAPFGDPMILFIHGCRLALRKHDASNIMVSVL
ncbi:MAG TPA: FeoA family protein [Methanocorpusculum sp.]|nr:FeoA family protein [Methanocorpusculum sp.]